VGRRTIVSSFVVLAPIEFGPRRLGKR